MNRDLEILQHALGLDRYGRGEPWRNGFVTGPGSTDWDDCLRLTERGLMRDHGQWAMAPDSHLFTVTEDGIAYVHRESPSPPRLTRSQRGYREFLAADCGLSFGEWLRAGRKGEG